MSLNRPEAPFDGVTAVESRVMNHFFHDFKGELSTVVMCLDSIRDGLLCERAHVGCSPWLDRAIKKCTHMVRLINDHRDLSLIEEGAWPREPEVVDLAARLIRCRSFMCEEARGRFVVDVGTRGSVPRVRLPATLFDRLLANVLQVAITSTRRGGKLRVEGRSADGFDRPAVTLEVTIEGIEFSREELETVFDKLLQTETGLLLGRGYTLLFCKAAARYMGGDLLLEPAPGLGTRIIIKLPSMDEAR
jgi:signal transduction histidine kinase